MSESIKQAVREVIEQNKGKPYTIRIRDVEDLFLVSEIAESLGYVVDVGLKDKEGMSLLEWYEMYVLAFDTRYVEFYAKNEFGVHNHDCLLDCLLDLTK